MYINGISTYFEKTNFTISTGRIGHCISINANPVMTIFPRNAYRKVVEFPVFV